MRTKSLNILQRTQQEIFVDQDFRTMLLNVERTLSQLLGSKDVLVFWNEMPTSKDVNRNYLRFVIESMQFDRKLRSTLQIESVGGEKKRYFYFPIIQAERLYGYILIQQLRFQLLHKRVERMLSYIISLLVYQYEQLRSKKVVEKEVLSQLQKKVAQDIHDGVAQKLFFLSAQLYSIKKDMLSRLNANEISRLEQLSHSLGDSLAELRSYMLQLRNCHWQGDFFQQIRRMIESKTASTNLEVRFQTIGIPVCEKDEVLETIYLILEEATSNVLKHAKATTLEISIEVTLIQWQIRITDNGIGLSNSDYKNTNRLGLLGITERVQQVDGFVSIHSNNRQGTEIVAIIPRKNCRERGNIFEAI